MDDGLYLATYITPPGLANSIGWWTRHDNNVSLWQKSGRRVELLGHWEFERFADSKHFGLAAPSAELLAEFVGGLLSDLGVKLDQVAEIWGTPGFGGTAAPVTFGRGSGLPVHALCHLYASMFLDSSIFRSKPVLGLAADGRPDSVLDQGLASNSFAGGVLLDGRLSTFPIASPGPIFRRASEAFGLEEGSLMALTTASSATVVSPFDTASVVTPSILRGRRAGKEAEHLVASVRKHVEQVGWTRDERFDEQDNYVSSVMKTIQEMAIAVMASNIEFALERFDLDPRSTYYAPAGGFALNCLANSHLMERYQFEGFLAPPFVNDGGQSIGLGLGEFVEALGSDFYFSFPGAYLGTRTVNLHDDFVKHSPYIEDVQDVDLDVVVADLIEAPIAWFDGRAESGPRALGHRSILSDPRSLAAKEKCNRIKQRQWWRPVAPVVLEERVEEWFEGARRSPYMLETFRLRSEKESRVPAIAHLDGSARVQTVTAAENPRLHALLLAFEAATGVPILCNTSLNDRGEPIINTAAQAFNFCLRKGMAVAYFEGRRVRLWNHQLFPETSPTSRSIGWTAGNAAAPADQNPCGLDDLYVFVYLENPELRAAYDISTDAGAAGLRAAIDLMFATDPNAKKIATATLARRGSPAS
jgi:carbamoyltransferase